MFAARNIFQTTSAGGAARAAQYYGSTSTSTHPNTSANIMNLWYRRSVIAYTYTAAELSGYGLITGSVISKLRWYVTDPAPSAYQPMPNYAITMEHIGSATSSSNPTQISGANLTTVKNQHGLTQTTVGYHEVTLDNTFTWNGTDGIGFVHAWGQVPTGYVRDGISYVQPGNVYFTRTDGAGTYPVSQSVTSTYSNQRPVVELFST